MAGDTFESFSTQAILKEYYGGDWQNVEAVLFRDDPFFKEMRKIRVTGKNFRLPVTYSASPAVGSDYNEVADAAIENGDNISFALVPGNIFAAFVIDPKEYLATKDDRGAFISLYALRAFGTMDALRKILASCLYHMGYLETGPIVAVDATNFIYIDVDPSTVFGLDIGTRVMFAASVTTAYRSPNYVKIASIASSPTAGLVRITFESAYVATVAVADQVMIKGGRDASLNPLAPIGLGQWLPYLAHRTGGTWTTYIGTAFYGVVRSAWQDRLAGNYYRLTGGEKLNAVVNKGVKLARRMGGVPDRILLNDDDFGTIIDELQASRNFWQAINTAGNKDRNVVNQGLSQIMFAFSTNWIQYVYDSPAVPKGVGWIIDSESIAWVGFGNIDTITSSATPPSGNDPGAPKVTQSQGEMTKNYQFLIDDLFTTSPVDTKNGKGLKVDYSIFGTYGVKAPGHNSVVEFT